MYYIEKNNKEYKKYCFHLHDFFFIVIKLRIKV